MLVEVGIQSFLGYFFVLIMKKVDTKLNFEFLIQKIGECNLIPTKYKKAETFVCLIYGIGNVDSEDAALRVMFMFQKGSNKPKMMPPTKDALQLHIQHVHHHAAYGNLHSALFHIFLMSLRWDGHETIDGTRF